MAQVIEKGKLMNRYFEKRIESAIAQVPFFGFGQVVWGGGYTEVVDSVPSVIANLPDDIASPTGAFATTNAIYTYDSVAKELRVQASLPKNSVPAGQTHTWTTCYVLDKQGGIVAIAVGLPYPVTSNFSGAIDFILDVGRPTV